MSRSQRMMASMVPELSSLSQTGAAALRAELRFKPAARRVSSDDPAAGDHIATRTRDRGAMMGMEAGRRARPRLLNRQCAQAPALRFLLRSISLLVPLHLEYG